VVVDVKGNHMRITRPKVVIFSCTSLLLGILSCMAQNYPSAALPPPALSSAVEDIIKLSRAQISEAVIINYIETSGTLYDLKARDVIHLRDEGVTDSIINTMIDQRRKIQTDPAPEVAPAPEPVVQPSLAPASTATQCPLSCNRCGSPMFSQSGPLSTVYVIPYSGSGYMYWNDPNWGTYSYYGPWQRAFHGPWLYRCGHWHGCSHGH
jgi:hypothetical protein